MICTRKGWRRIASIDRLNDPSRSRAGKTLILGLGNTILTDDGVGIYVSRELGKRLDGADVDVMEASLGGLELLDPMIGYARAILIDAMPLSDREIGDIVRLTPEDLEGGSAMARHHVPFHEALQVGRHLGMDLPEAITIYGIQVKDTMTFGESCTEELAACIPRIVDDILESEFG